MRSRAWIAAVLLGLLVVAAIVLIRAAARDEGADVNATTLARSLAREAGPGPARCRRGRRFQYLCRAGGDAFRVTLTGDGCWRAVPILRASERLSGCVTAADQPD